MATVVTDGDVYVLFALSREAKPFRAALDRKSAVVPLVTGVGSVAAKEFAAGICVLRPKLVIAAGFCGGLQPGLAVGDVVAPDEVIGADGRKWPCAALGGLPQIGRLLTGERLIGDPRLKAALGEQYSAVAVDMESAGVAEACEAADVPFAAVRVVSDTVTTAIDPQLTDLIAGGRVRFWKTLAAVLRRPSLLAEFRRLASDTDLAARRLSDTLFRLTAIKRPDSPSSSP